ncbi:MAG: hypothetical protein EAY81_08965 [Bacteroidetes bacterium]|nr:MAG: hypothetical protein EAY81_08965 [Bacteroidota bacterium]
MLKKAIGLISISLMPFWCQLSAQNLTKSPYSFIGLGDLHFTGSAWMHGMGQVNQAISGTTIINNQNPASYSKLLLTTWDFAGTGALGTISSDKGVSNVNTGSLAYFALGLPLSTKLNWGFSLGLMPYSNVGYNINRTVVTSTFTGTETTSGTGGTSRFYLGSGIKITKRLSVGVNGSYIFGKIERNALLNIPRSFNMYNLAESGSTYIGDFLVDIGVQYSDTFSYKKHKYSWGIGATLTPQANLATTSDFSTRTLGVGITDPNNVGKDSIKYKNDERGEVRLPSLMQTGVYFGEEDKWRVAADVQYQNWRNFSSFNQVDSLTSNTTLKLGASIIPNIDDEKHYLSRIEYRVGFRYDNGNILFNDNRIKVYAISAGLGLPLGKSRSKLNLSAEYIVRGTTQYNLIREEYFRFTVGVLICDRWFQRYRYD